MVGKESCSTTRLLDVRDEGSVVELISGDCDAKGGILALHGHFFDQSMGKWIESEVELGDRCVIRLRRKRIAILKSLEVHNIRRNGIDW